MFRRSLYVRKHGFVLYQGSPERIARQIIDACWDGKRGYFRVSGGHFNEFYCRDFGMCAESLVKLGYSTKVRQTLDYALKKFKANGRMTTSIAQSGKCFDFPYYGADSLPFIVHALLVSGSRALVSKYRSFLEQEIKYYAREVFDPKTGLVAEGKRFSSIKDYARRPSSCYSNCMLYMLAHEAPKLGLKCSLPAERIRKTILATFWNGKYFFDNTSFSKHITGDANTFPFWCQVTDSEDVFRRCLRSMESAGLTTPFPLKYHADREKIHEYHFFDFLAGDYERDTVWIHLGLCFLDVVKRFDKKMLKLYLDQYRGLIEKHRNFLEVYDSTGHPFRNLFYHSDESMVWVSKWLALSKG